MLCFTSKIILNQREMKDVPSSCKNWRSWPRGKASVGGAKALPDVLRSDAGTRPLRSVHELMASLWPHITESRWSPNRRVCLFKNSRGPLTSDRQVELREMEGAVASDRQVELWETQGAVASDTWGLSCCWADTLGCLRRLLSFLVSLFIGLLEALLDCRLHHYIK